ncbi:peptidoglycan-binding domain-containing protein [Candidatus Rhodobacter oscarellae]|nr:hypothetical protein [Candidatus Rhodobacter lobularis]
MARFLLSFVVALLVLPVSAQEASVVATGEGTFAGAAGLDPEQDSDAIAALEQQAWREYRWEVLADQSVAMTFAVAAGPAAEDWPEAVALLEDAAKAALLISEDGEVFAPLPGDGLARAGQVLAVLISQKAVTLEGGLVFYPSVWAFDLEARAVEPSQDATVGPMLLPIQIAPLGCDTPGCGEAVEEVDPVAVDGEANAEAGTGPNPAPSASAGAPDGLARELQAELARVGCYTIAIDGLWGPGSRRAMTAYNAARGADLAVQTATAKALAAVAKETGAVCGE